MITTTPNLPSHVWNDFFEYSVGYDQLLRKIMTSHEYRSQNNSYPPFNVSKKDSTSYEISIALAGFTSKDIEVTQKDTILTIRGEAKEEDTTEYLVKNIASRLFTKTFALNEHARVDNVSLNNGILSIIIKIEVPEEQQPKTFKIEE